MEEYGNANETFNIMQGVKNKIKEIREFKKKDHFNHLEGLEDQINSDTLKSFMKSNNNVINDNTISKFQVTPKSTSNLDTNNKSFLNLKQEYNITSNTKVSFKGSSLLKPDFLEDNNTDNGDFSILKQKSNYNNQTTANLFEKNNNLKNLKANSNITNITNSNYSSSQKEYKLLNDKNKEIDNSLFYNSNSASNNYNSNYNSNTNNKSLVNKELPLFLQCDNKDKENLYKKKVEDLWNSNSNQKSSISAIFNKKNENNEKNIKYNNNNKDKDKKITIDRKNCEIVMDSCLNLKVIHNSKNHKSNILNETGEFLNKVKADEKSFLNFKSSSNMPIDIKRERDKERSKSAIRENIGSLNFNNKFSNSKNTASSIGTRTGSVIKLIENSEKNIKTNKKPDILNSINEFIRYNNYVPEKREYTTGNDNSNYNNINKSGYNSFRASASKAKPPKTMREMLDVMINNKSNKDLISIASNLEKVITSNKDKDDNNAFSEKNDSKNISNISTYNLTVPNLVKSNKSNHIYDSSIFTTNSTFNRNNSNLNLKNKDFSEKEKNETFQSLIYRKNTGLGEKASINLFKTAFDGFKEKAKNNKGNELLAYSGFISKRNKNEV